MPDHDSAATETFLPLMHDVVRCDRSLRELNLTWRMIESSTKMNCPEEARRILPTMAATREHFNQLEQELVASLVREKVATVMREISTKAHYVIDIVVRNLYERTADVGFLATDGELCAFVAGAGGEEERGAIVQRLRAYRSKYTVYDEIFLLDPAGRVLAQIDDESPLQRSTDPIVRQALASEGFVERFGASDLRPAKRQALLYAKRMLHPDSGAVVGVLCLCFNFEQEMAGIFASHRDPAARYNMLLLDGGNRCIESADQAWIPVGAQLPVNSEATPTIFMYAGRQYLVSTFAAQGYQGYAGPPGWQGQVMLPLDVAFGSEGNGAADAMDPALRRGLLTHASSFCPPLHQIVVAADTIRRVVWNGQVMTAGGQEGNTRLKTVLEQLSETGNRSNELFAQSIRDLYQTVLSSSMRNAEFVSHLLVDLLDRNLYERADDCRWWALTPLFRRALASGDAGDMGRIAGLLAGINRLYTVYTRLFVYDADGAIVAHSDRDRAAAGVTGSRVDPATLARVLALHSEQGYVVTPFEASPLYEGEPTYVYHAAIHAPGDGGRVVGGIGLVFDSGIELEAMLSGGLAGRAGTDAFFVDRDGRVISSTDASRPAGSVLQLDPALLALAGGSSASSLVVHDGQYAVMGCTVCSGYREFKVSDGYRDDVIAVVVERFGAVRAGVGAGSAALSLQGDFTSHGGREYATFFSGEAVFALDVEHVREARPASEVTRVTIGAPARSAGVLRLNPARADEMMIWVFDLALLLGGPPSAIEGSSQVVVVEHAGRTIGLLVGELHAVSAFDLAQMSGAPLAGGHGLVKAIVKANGGASLIQLLDADSLFALFQPPQEVSAANDALGTAERAVG